MMLIDLELRQSKETEKSDITTKLSWIAFQDQFFSSVIITNDFFLNGSVVFNTNTGLTKIYQVLYIRSWCSI